MDFMGILGVLIGMLIVLSVVYSTVLLASLFVRLIMRSFDRVHQLSMRGLVLWGLGTSLLVLIFELLGRFFLLSIGIQLQFATHILGVLGMHVIYFIIAGLATRAFLQRHHVSISAHDAVVFMACVGICFYFLLGSVAGVLISVTNNYTDSASGKIVAKQCAYVQGLSMCFSSKDSIG